MSTQAKLLKQFGIKTHSGADNFDDYVDINRSQIEMAYQAFHADPTIKTCFNVMLNAQIGRGIVIRKAGGLIPDADSDRFFQMAFGRFVAEMYRSWVMYGVALAVVEPSKEFKGIPHVIDLRQVHVKVKTLPWNKRYYVCFPRSSSSSVEPTSLTQDKAVKGLIVFESKTDDPPDINGNLMSKAIHAVPHLIRFQHLTQLHYQALKINANPIIFEERKEAKYDPESAQYGNVFGASITETDKEDHVEPISVHQLRILQEQVSRVRSHNTGRPFNDAAGTQQVVDELMRDNHARLIRLPENSVVSNPVSVESIKDYEEQRLAYQETVCSIMGLPHRYLNESKYKFSGNHEEKVVYENNQNALKHAFIEALYRMYWHVYGSDSTDPGVQGGDVENTAEENELQVHNSKIEISLPGLPDPEEMRTLFFDGLLKYRSYVKYNQKRLDLSEDDFNKDLKMPVPPKDGPETGPDAQKGIGNAKRKDPPKPKKKESNAPKKQKPNATISVEVVAKKGGKK